MNNLEQCLILNMFNKSIHNLNNIYKYFILDQAALVQFYYIIGQTSLNSIIYQFTIMTDNFYIHYRQDVRSYDTGGAVGGGGGGPL